MSKKVVPAGTCPHCGEPMRNFPEGSDTWNCLFCDAEVIVEGEVPLDGSQQLDLYYVTNLLRSLELKLAQLPLRRGKADSATRAQLRNQRTQLRDQIQDARDDIVAWAIANVPVDSAIGRIEMKDEDDV